MESFVPLAESLPSSRHQAVQSGQFVLNYCANVQKKNMNNLQWFLYVIYKHYPTCEVCQNPTLCWLFLLECVITVTSSQSKMILYNNNYCC